MAANENIESEKESKNPALTSYQHVGSQFEDSNEMSNSSNTQNLPADENPANIDLDPSQGETAGVDDNQIECAICLQQSLHPVQLPCSHVFCYLCVKGSSNRAKRCALCRTDIPGHFINKPKLLKSDDLLNTSSFDDGFQWFYAGKNSGWWRYDQRTSEELEEKYKNGIGTFEILIAGYLYVIDLEQMFQYRRSDPSRRRKIKRDQINKVSTKGVAGLTVKTDEHDATERENGDGINISQVRAASTSRPPLITQIPAYVQNNRELPLSSTFGNQNVQTVDISLSPNTNHTNDDIVSRMGTLSLVNENASHTHPTAVTNASNSAGDE